jgi:alkylated DNA repair dioxygenase AlkB
MAESVALRDGGLLFYEPAFFSVEEADALLAFLRREVPWQQEIGRGRPFPRLTAWYADAGLCYRYSGVVHEGTGWLPKLRDIKERVEAAARMPFNSLLLNLYRDGRDSIGLHADDEPELGPDPVVASLSLGAVRQFVLKHKATGEKQTFPLAHGSLLVMAGTCQHYWLHGVPKTATPVGERINLTFRQIFVS